MYNFSIIDGQKQERLRHLADALFQSQVHQRLNGPLLTKLLLTKSHTLNTVKEQQKSDTK